MRNETRRAEWLMIASRASRAFRRLGPIGFLGLAVYNVMLLVTGRYREHRYAYDRSFDREYGVDTAGTVALDELDAAEELKQRAKRYEAADPDFFTFLLERAGLENCRDYLFIDLGSGKGRALLLAALAGFRHVIGVELDPGLEGIARRNIATFSGHSAVEIISVNSDATLFEFPAAPTVLFLNNPFDEQLLEKILAKVEIVHSGSAPDFLLIYMHSNYEDLVRVRNGWEAVDQGIFLSRRQFYAIFRWRGIDRHD